MVHETVAHNSGADHDDTGTGRNVCHESTYRLRNTQRNAY